MIDISRRVLNAQLARVIAINLICVLILLAGCAISSLCSLSVLAAYWNEHRASSMVAIMIALVLIPSLLHLVAARFGFWQR